MAATPKACLDEETARRWLENIRWRQVRRCPHCRGTRTSAVANANPMPYHCSDCRRYFSVRTGTCIAGSRVPLRTWVHAIHLMSRGVRGTLQFGEALGVHHETVRKLEATIREAWAASQEHESAQGETRVATRVQGPESRKPRGRPRKVRDPLPATPREIAATLLRAAEAPSDEQRPTASRANG